MMSKHGTLWELISCPCYTMCLYMYCHYLFSIQTPNLTVGPIVAVGLNRTYPGDKFVNHFCSSFVRTCGYGLSEEGT